MTNDFAPQEPVTDDVAVDLEKDVEVDDGSIVIDSYDTEALKQALENERRLRVQEKAKKLHWRNKFEKLQTEKISKEENAEPKKNSADLQTKGEPVDVDSLLDIHESIKTLGGDELNELRSEARNLGLDPVRYIKSKAGQAHLNMFRETKKAETSTPAPSNKIPSFNGRPINDIFVDDKASDAEKQAAYEAKIKGKGLNQNI